MPIETHTSGILSGADSLGWIGKFPLTRKFASNPVFLLYYPVRHKGWKYLYLLLVCIGLILGFGSRVLSGVADFTYTIFGITLAVLLVPVFIQWLKMCWIIPDRVRTPGNAPVLSLLREGKSTVAGILQGVSLPELLKVDRNIISIVLFSTGLLVGWYAGALTVAHSGPYLGLTEKAAHLSEFQIISWLSLYQFWMSSKVILIMSILAFALAGTSVSIRSGVSAVLSIVITIVYVVLSREISLRVVEFFYELPEWYRNKFFYFLYSPGWRDFRVSLWFAVLEVGFIGLGAMIAYRLSLRVLVRAFKNEMEECG